MFLRQKLKLIRKFDSDIWNFIYMKQRKNKFFTYFRLSLIEKIKQNYLQNLIYLSEDLDYLTITKYPRLVNLTYKKLNLNLINYTNLFEQPRQSINHVFFNIIQGIDVQTETLFGNRSSFQHYNEKLLSPYARLRLNVKKISLFYNNLNPRKLRKLGIYQKKVKKVL